jgi:hypothetical protein
LDATLLNLAMLFPYLVPSIIAPCVAYKVLHRLGQQPTKASLWTLGIASAAWVAVALVKLIEIVPWALHDGPDSGWGGMYFLLVWMPFMLPAVPTFLVVVTVACLTSFRNAERDPIPENQNSD